MKFFFTICSNNYLAHAKVLFSSLKKNEPASRFVIFLCDEKNQQIDYTSLADEVIPVGEIEPAINELALQYNITELNTCIKPRAIEYLFGERGMDNVIYLDPDIKVFDSFSNIYAELEQAAILLTPHIYTPIPIDSKKPSENTFLIFGVFNLGFIALNKSDETKRFIEWWKERTYQQGFIDTYKGLFVDQLPVNLAPVFFKNVKLLYDFGANMAPWNLHERYLSFKEEKYFVNEIETLKFYHFSSFKADMNELPLQHYNRFKLAGRPDLQKIYEAYNEELKSAEYFFYQKFECSYSIIRERHLAKLKKQRRTFQYLFKKLAFQKKK